VRYVSCNSPSNSSERVEDQALPTKESGNKLNPQLEAVERALFLFLAGVQLSHPLLQRLPGPLGADAHLALFLDGLQAHARVAALLAQADEFVFEALALALPVVHVRLGAVGRRLEVDEGFFEGGGQLLLGEEVLLDCADAGFLFFDHLSHASAGAGSVL
jgi:hypothetical protein